MLNKNIVLDKKAILEKRLKELGDELGLDLTLGKVSFNSLVADFSLKMAIKSGDGKSIAELEYEKIAPFVFELKGVNFGDSFMYDGRKMKVRGFKPSRPKYPLLCECEQTGRLFKFPTNVLSLINK